MLNHSAARPFLRAEWRHLAMLNYEVDPEVLRGRVPPGTELDDWQGHVLVSIVGFLFLDTRVLGIRIPRHRDFEEVNLRFYVRRRDEDEWRRGVVFIREIVPRIAIAWVANAVYGENYLAAPMDHGIAGGDGTGPLGVRYSWWLGGIENHMAVCVNGRFREPSTGSAEEFIAEHYWGYVKGKGRTMEYRVEHPRWRVVPAETARLECDVARLYGSEFTGFLREPVSAFLAEGSEVAVFRGRPVA